MSRFNAFSALGRFNTRLRNRDWDAVKMASVALSPCSNANNPVTGSRGTWSCNRVEEKVARGEDDGRTRTREVGEKAGRGRRRWEQGRGRRWRANMCGRREGVGYGGTRRRTVWGSGLRKESRGDYLQLKAPKNIRGRPSCHLGTEVIHVVFHCYRGRETGGGLVSTL